MGLGVWYGIVRAHQGEMHAKNLEGGGARFVIQLPVAPAALVSRSQSAAIRN